MTVGAHLLVIWSPLGFAGSANRLIQDVQYPLHQSSDPPAGECTLNAFMYVAAAAASKVSMSLERVVAVGACVNRQGSSNGLKGWPDACTRALCVCHTCSTAASEVRCDVSVSSAVGSRKTLLQHLILSVAPPKQTLPSMRYSQIPQCRQLRISAVASVTHPGAEVSVSVASSHAEPKIHLLTA
jgi:hypothetical protein